MERIREFIYSLVFKLKAPLRFLPILAVILATGWYVLDPMGKPYIRVPGNYLALDLRQFRRCEITFKDPVPIKSFGISKVAEDTDASQKGAVAIKRTQVEQRIKILVIENPYYQPTQLVNNLKTLYHVRVYIGPSLHSDIEAVSLDGNSVDLKLFSKGQLKVPAEFVRFKRLREDLADILFRLNDPVSNWILTLMFFGIIALTIKLFGMEVRAYFYSDPRFDEYLAKTFDVDNLAKKGTSEDAFDLYAAYWASLDKRFQFLQALGPAVGFILTVSSLVQALNPALRATNDIDSFLKGIHVAMIATFLGLLTRLVALEAARINDKLLSRADVRLAAIASRVPDHSTSSVHLP